MIGDGWDDVPAVRPQQDTDDLDIPAGTRRVAVVTGTRAEFGLLRPVMHAIAKRRELSLMVIASGSHLVSPALTFHDVKRDFAIADIVPMQIAGRTGRLEDVESLARGVARFGRSFAKLRPDWVLTLGDRIEAFAAASAASIGGFALAHIHGGDRAEGVADEAMRHAITKLAHLHFPATPTSRDRIIRMGEDPARVHCVGSPAMDELAKIAPLNDAAFVQFGAPTIIFLLHPTGQPDEIEEAAATAILDTLRAQPAERLLIMEPNLDPGRDGIMRAIRAAGLPSHSNIDRSTWIALLKRLAVTQPARGVLVGNSSAGLIEAAAISLPVVDIGLRQRGRERCDNVTHIDHVTSESLVRAIAQSRSTSASYQHPYGDGGTAERIAHLLVTVNPRDALMLRKQNMY
jgi:UDP-hydrolysing UDP-N-acetyl-D-glucosamine 2-epimerase